MNDFQPGFTVSERTISAFPLSVGTSLALESLFSGSLAPIDPERQIVHVNPNRYQEIWINLSTLFRNVVQACSKEAVQRTSVQEYVDTLLLEIQVINTVFAEQSSCIPMFYHMTYPRVESKAKSKKIILRDPKTDLQRKYHYNHDTTIDRLYKLTDSIRLFKDTIIPPHRTDALILTHLPYDLLSRPKFNSLALLESHTGLVKDRTLWASKLYPLPETDMSHLPFNELSLFIFGDKVQISPSVIKLRRLVYECSLKRHWNPLTTPEKMKLDLSLEIKEPFVVSWLKSL